MENNTQNNSTEIEAGTGRNRFLFQIQRKGSCGNWFNDTTTGTTGHQAFGRLIGRVRSGEMDPQEQYFRLLPLNFGDCSPTTWDDIREN